MQAGDEGKRIVRHGNIIPGEGVLPAVKMRKVTRVQEEPVIDIAKISGHPKDSGLVSELIGSYVNGSLDFNVGIHEMEPGQYHPRHMHPAGAEFYYVMEGSCLVTVDDEEVQASAGTAIYIPKRTVHSIRTTDSGMKLLWAFDKPDFRDAGITWLE